MSGSEDDRILVVDEPCFDGHVDPRGHPERPERLDAARSGLRKALGVLPTVPAPIAAPEDLARVHTKPYLDELEDALASGHGNLDPDTYVSPGTREAALRATGAAVGLVGELSRGVAKTGFLLLRPPGHHATADRAMGFCLLNHIAIAAASALSQGAKRIAIVDWDVHHGNGTQAIFEEDPRVLFASLHQWPLYPGTGRHDEIGRGAGRGYTINVGLPAGTDGTGYGHALEALVLPRIVDFAPDLLLVSAGFDGHQRDPLASHELDAATYGAMATALLDLDSPTAFFLEGGYDLIALEESVEAVGHAMRGRRTELPGDSPTKEARQAVAATARAHDRRD